MEIQVKIEVQMISKIREKIKYYIVQYNILSKVIKLTFKFFKNEWNKHIRVGNFIKRKNFYTIYIILYNTLRNVPKLTFKFFKKELNDHINFIYYNENIIIPKKDHILYDKKFYSKLQSIKQCAELNYLPEEENEKV